jgi:hypothetical protein
MMELGHSCRVVLYLCLFSLLAAPAALAQGVLVDGTLGTTGSGLGEFQAPHGFCYAGALWVVDSGNDRVQRIQDPFAYQSEHGDPGYSVFGSTGSGPGQFRNPTAIAADPDRSELFVTDTGNDRIEVFDYSGNWLRSFGQTGSGPGQFQGPAWIAVYNGEVYVTDAGNDRVEVFDPAGNFLRQWGSDGTDPGQFHHPSGIAVVSENEVLVADSDLGTVQQFATGGDFEEVIASGLDEPQGLSLDGSEIALAGANCIRWGGACTDFSAASRGFGSLSAPHQAEGYCCYWGVITDTGNDRLLILVGPDPVEASTWGLLKQRYGR